MARTTEFYCTNDNCDATSAKWVGKCPKCKEFNTMEERTIVSVAASSPKNAAAGARLSKATTGASPQRVSQIRQGEPAKRLSTNISEFDRVVGGGLVPGSVVLFAGSPGAGKSTLCGMISQAVAIQDKTVLYISGEENETQIADRSMRIGATSENFYILSESSLPEALKHIEALKPDLVIVDSIQTLVTGATEARAGSPGQVVEVANDLTRTAKTMNIPTILIGHITKDGSVAGPRMVEHLVDVVLYLEASDDSTLRLLRGIKNRYGATDEIGCFEHAEEGLVEITDPSGFFTAEHDDDITGYATSILVEGQRALPVEIQALVSRSKLPNPRKISHGLDHARCLMIQAILEKYAGIRLDDKDVYVSTTGGLTVKDSSIDLAIAAAIISSANDQRPAKDSVYIGELSLTGEVRKARFAEKRIREAKRLGLTNTKSHVEISSIRILSNKD